MSPTPHKAAYGGAVSTQNLAMAERLGVERWDLEVARIADLTTSLREITFRCHAPDSLAYLPGNDLTLAIAAEGERIVRRRYSVRRVDPQARTVDLDFVLHGDGPGGRWAAAAEIGDRIEGVGPRGKITVFPDRAWHLFVADEAFLPAASSMLESLPDGIDAHLFVEVDGPKDEIEISCRATVATLRWCHRDGVAPGTSSALQDTIATFAIPPGAGAAYIGGEQRSTNSIRDLLIRGGMAAEDVAAKAYWRLGKANADRGEPDRDE